MILANTVFASLHFLALIIVALGIAILYRRTGHTIGVALFAGLLSLTPILILPIVYLGFLPSVEYTSLIAIADLIPPSILLVIALKKWPKFDLQGKLKDVF